MLSRYGMWLMVALLFASAAQVLGLLDAIGVLSPQASVASGNRNGGTGIELNTVGGNQKETVVVISTITRGNAAPGSLLRRRRPSVADDLGATAPGGGVTQVIGPTLGGPQPIPVGV